VTRWVALSLSILAAVMLSARAQAADEPPPPAAAQAPEYVIGPGDILQVFVWRNPELSVTVPVRPDGKISTPLVEDMVAVGKTPSVLARDIEVVLAEFVRSPTVNIIVTQPVSRFSQVRVVGQVARPQAIAYREGMTVLDVILESGGVTPFAAGNRARVVREVNGKKTELPVRLGDILNRGRMETNVEVLPGDVIVVPESFF
jgi:polysaccharide export outer membrane protein